MCKICSDQATGNQITKNIFTWLTQLLCYCFINVMIKNYAPFKNCTVLYMLSDICDHDDVIKWKHFPCYWPFVWEIHWSPVNSTPHPPGQWCGALMFSLICVWINGWVNSGEAGDLRRYHTHYDVTVMDLIFHFTITQQCWLKPVFKIKASPMVQDW